MRGAAGYLRRRQTQVFLVRADNRVSPPAGILNVWLFHSHSIGAIYYTCLMKLRHGLYAAILLALALYRPGVAALFDHSEYDTVLRDHVDDEGYVDYTSIRQNSLTALESYFERLAEADLAGWSPQERLAFWINAYNARVIYAVAQKPGLKKISDDFNLFNRPFKIAGRMLSLNDIKHRILRGTLNRDNHQGPILGLSFAAVNPEIHFGLVSGDLSCPKLRASAYTAENVGEALHANSLAFVNSFRYVNVADGRLKTSSLFKWYAGDFATSGDVPTFILSRILPNKRGDADAVKQLLETAYQKTLFAYDWTINDQQNNPSLQQPRLAPAPDEIPPDALSNSDPDLGEIRK